MTPAALTHLRNKRTETQQKKVRFSFRVAHNISTFLTPVLFSAMKKLLI